MTTEPIIKPSKLESSVLLVLIVLIISLSMIVIGTVPHIPILGSILMLFTFGILKKASFHDLQKGMSSGAASGMNAIFLFFFIGMIISAFMISGTIPTLMYAGLSIADWPYYFAIVFVVTALIGISIGSSLTTAATLGVAFIGISSSLDFSLALTAGAVVSGAFFGDKMSPLSDTTNLASSVVDVDLFEHIRNMAWTTVPAFLLSIVGYGLLSPEREVQLPLGQIERMQELLAETGLIHWYSILPILLLFLLAIKKVPALLSLSAAILVSISISFFHDSVSAGQLAAILFDGYESATGVEEIDSLLTRGGISSMMFTVSLVILALGLGGLLFKLGIIQTVLSMMESGLKNTSSVLLSAAGAAFSINVVIGEQYLSILLAGESFKRHADEVKLARKNLSRALEDAGTVINPLIPWGVCGVFLTNVLEVPTLDYLPYAFFCLICPVLTVIYSKTGWTISPQK
ncbi:Na+/H+ antiporter NhaC [Jeotgalibacillus proteolyticus]|uniref:Na+/H+ antiporter NhaC n=1 Tax=Jeotgalibacillus proteolyticus TaxID=2082395 RepID=A0A2S5GH58_9BACL|nr:Na+/H+ antiporter NhaC [Jeotgalibacillus proteolyticus]PPA72254.1 Na+/H+ antiporter NhaC [Jeotgalibacillus proteolyticus]